MNRKVKIPVDIWEDIKKIFVQMPEVQYISLNTVQEIEPGITVYLKTSDGKGLLPEETQELDFSYLKSLKVLQLAQLDSPDPSDGMQLQTIEEVHLSAPIQPGDRVAHATLGLFVNKKYGKRIMFITANHAMRTGRVIQATSRAIPAKIISRSPTDLDILVARFVQPVEIENTIKKMNVTPKRIVNSWEKNQQFALTGMITSEVALGRAIADNILISRQQIAQERTSKDYIKVRINQFEILLESGYEMNSGDSGGPVILTDNKGNYLDQVAGIIIELGKIREVPVVVATKMSAIEKKFRIKLLSSPPPVLSEKPETS